MKSKMPQSGSSMQGEGDHRSAEKYNKSAHEFAASGKVEQAARDAAPRNKVEKNEMTQAEEEGRSHAKGTTAGKVGKTAQRKPAKQAPDIDPIKKPLPEKLSKSQATRKP